MKNHINSFRLVLVFVLMNLHLVFVPISFLALTGSIFGVVLAFTVLVRVLSQPANTVQWDVLQCYSDIKKT